MLHDEDRSAEGLAPSTSAAGPSLWRGDDRSRIVGEVVELVLEEQSRRRSRRLAYGLLVIPANAGLGVAIAAYAGLSYLGLALGGFFGLFVGAPLMTVMLGQGRPQNRKQDLHALLARFAADYGLSASERRAAWKRLSEGGREV